jgi:integrase/recombinase XerD
VYGRDPTDGLELAKEPQTLPKNILTPKEAKRLIESVDTGHARGYRDRTLLEILYGSGIRSQELINLTVKDIDFEEELLRINGGKGAKDRVVPLSRMACRMLETYLKGVRPELLHGEKTNRLFLSVRGRPLHRYNLGKLIHAHAKRAGIPQRITAHVWRHTCATHLLKNNVNLRYVQELLGHRLLTTTEKYLRVTITDLKEAHRKHHPREKGTLES